MIVATFEEHAQNGSRRKRAEERLGQLVELANGTLGEARDSLEHMPGGTAARRENTRTTLEYLDKLNRDTSNDKRVLSALAYACVRLARIELDPQQPNLGNLSDAGDSFRKSARILNGLLAREPDNTGLQIRTVESRLGLWKSFWRSLVTKQRRSSSIEADWF